jgi:hypothetical protein
MKGKKFSGCLIKLDNATIVLLDEKENIRLGTLAAGVPEFEGKHRISSVLLGERNEMEARLLAERVSATMGGISIVSIYFEPLNGLDSLVPIMKLTTQLIEKTQKKSSQESEQIKGE